MKLKAPIRLGQVRIEVKEVQPRENQRGYGYGNCRTWTVYETSAAELAVLIERTLNENAEDK